MKGNSIMLLLFLVMCCPQGMRAQGWQWISGGLGGSEGYGIAVDQWGNIFTTGYASNKDTFGTTVLSDLGDVATLVVKMDANGNFLWADATHGGHARPIDIAIDSAGNLYVFGYYLSDSLQVGPYTLVHTAPGAELYMARYNANGGVQWAGNLCEGDVTGNLSVNQTGVYISGVFTRAAVTIGSTVLTNSDPSGNTDDIFLAKMDFDGNVVWARRYGGAGSDVGLIHHTVSGKLYMAGTSASPTVSFGSLSLSNVDTSLFLVLFDSTYTPQWAKNQLGIGKIGSFVAQVSADSQGNAFVTGSWRNTAYLGPQLLVADSVSNIFLAKFDTLGNVLWTHQVTGNGELYGRGVTLDNCGNAWICGGMGDQTPGHHGSNYIVLDSIRIKPPSGSQDPLFIAGWNNFGDFIRASILPTCGDDLASIGSDGAGGVYVAADYWYGPYDIAGRHLYDGVQPSENICVAKYNTYAADTSKVSTLVCMTDSAVLVAPPGYSSYRWADGSLARSRTVDSPGNYVLYGTGQCQAGVLREVFVVNYGKLDTTYARTDTTICQNAQALLLAPAAVNGYYWYNGTQAQTDTIDSPGTYWMAAMGSCTVPTILDTFHVKRNNINLTFSLGPDTVVCNPYQMEVPLAGVGYLWQDGTTLATDVATQTGYYFATVSEQNCFHTSGVNVQFVDLAQALRDTVLCLDQPVRITLTANVPSGATVLWSTGSTADSIFIREPGTYWVVVADAACTGADTMTVDQVNCACVAVMPGAFTPDGNGINETYHPLFPNYCPVYDYTFSIYNRWGQLVFVSHNPADRWDGTFHGTPQQTGTFMYHLEYRVEDVFHRHEQKGDFLLIR